MRQHGHQRRGSRGIGMFAGNIDPPQDGTAAIFGELQRSITDDPGIRVSTNNRRTFTGGGLTLQEFVRAPGQPNSDEALDVVPLQINSRRALSRFRGLPEELT